MAGHAFDGKLSPGAAYDRAMRQQVFEPMGMQRTTLSLDAALKDSDHATPYALDLHGKHHEVSLDHERFATYIRPSGGVWSSAREMANYVITELARGVAPGGKRVASEANLTHRWAPQVNISADVSYGLGWVTAKKQGLQLVMHGGGTMGFATFVAFVPSKGVGVVMISNGTGGHLVQRMTWTRLLELWFDTDMKASQRLAHTLKRKRAELAKLHQRTSPPDAEWIKPLLGVHHNAEVGQVSISKDQQRYVMDAGEYKTALLQHRRLDGKQVLLFTDPPLAGLEIIPLTDGKGSLEIKRGQERYLFQRRK